MSDNGPSRGSIPAEYFEALYARDPDPWRFASSDYEAAKYAATLAALTRPRYRRVLEVGCSIGVLTERLAGRCDRLIAVDVATRAVEMARDRTRRLGHVEVTEARVPDSWPEGSFDLVVLSEVVYYLDAADVRRLAERVKACLDPDGEVVLVHWTGQTDYPLSGDEAAERFIAAGAFKRVRGSASDQYRLDLLQRG